MAFPWLRVLDALIGVTDIARSRRIGKLRDDSESRQLETRAAPGALGGLETRLAGVVVAALREAFDRDTRRLDLEREQLEAERRRAERALQLELLRQAGDREIGRLRLLAGVAVASWLGTLFFATRLTGGSVGARVALGAGWLLLLAAIGASFSAQSTIAYAMERERDPRAASVAGTLTLWLIIVALAVIGIAVLV